MKRTIRTSLVAATEKNEKKKVNDDDDAFIITERAEDEIVKFLLGKVGFLKMNASGSVSRELRAREERKSGRKETVLSTTFVLRGGELVPTSEEGVDVESKGSRVNDGKIPADAEVGRFLADALASVPRLTREQFEKVFGDAIQDVLLVMYLSNVTKMQLMLAEKLQTASLLV